MRGRFVILFALALTLVFCATIMQHNVRSDVIHSHSIAPAPAPAAISNVALPVYLHAAIPATSQCAGIEPRRYRLAINNLYDGFLPAPHLSYRRARDSLSTKRGPQLKT